LLGLLGEQIVTLTKGSFNAFPTAAGPVSTVIWAVLTTVVPPPEDPPDEPPEEPPEDPLEPPPPPPPPPPQPASVKAHATKITVRKDLRMFIPVHL
jgi:hypothetical protein